MEDVPPHLLPHQPRRRGVLFALVATALALPLLLLDIRSDDSGDSSPVTTRGLSTVVVPLDRPETGPPKGISVVTAPTTSSTEPITTTTTTIAALTSRG